MPTERHVISVGAVAFRQTHHTRAVSAVGKGGCCRQGSRSGSQGNDKLTTWGLDNLDPVITGEKGVRRRYVRHRRGGSRRGVLDKRNDPVRIVVLESDLIPLARLAVIVQQQSIVCSPEGKIHVHQHGPWPAVNLVAQQLAGSLAAALTGLGDIAARLLPIGGLSGRGITCDPSVRQSGDARGEIRARGALGLGLAGNLGRQDLLPIGHFGLAAINPKTPFQMVSTRREKTWRNGPRRIIAKLGVRVGPPTRRENRGWSRPQGGPPSIGINLIVKITNPSSVHSPDRGHAYLLVGSTA